MFLRTIQRFAFRQHATATRTSASKLDVLFLSDAHNSMSQRAYLELTKMGHSVNVEIACSEQQMCDVVSKHLPDLIVCPFLTKRVHASIWKNYPTLIVHPGIRGDRGPSAIDWALRRCKPEWGVTVMSAAEQMDAGDIWSSKTFEVQRRASTDRPGAITKSSMYRNECINAAMEALRESVVKLQIGIAPTPLNYDDPNVKGTLNPKMKQIDRAVNFADEDAATIVRKIAANDGQPGTLHKFTIGDIEYFLHGAHVETELNRGGKFAPEQIIAQRDGAICIATANYGAVWITHLKRRNTEARKFIKLPAMDVLPFELIHRVPKYKIEPWVVHDPASSWRDVWVERAKDGVAFVHFEFYNGAMSTSQCVRLKETIQAVKADPSVRVIVFDGGYDAFSNGINLNTIEAADDPSAESWANINAINDVVFEMMHCADQVTVSALRGGAGAGGVMLALACDHVLTNDACVLNPHYRLMGLFGSEYWTYSLPRRVGEEMAQQLTEQCLPVSAKFAEQIGLVDAVLGADGEEFDIEMRRFAARLSKRSDHERVIADKAKGMTDAWRELLALHRERELNQMKQNFCDDRYTEARRRFVYKDNVTETPMHLTESHVSFGDKVLLIESDKNNILKM